MILPGLRRRRRGAAAGISYAYECTMTAGTFTYVEDYIGLVSLGPTGSLPGGQPIPSYTMNNLYSGSPSGDFYISFTTNVSSVLGSLSLYVNDVLITSLSGITTEKYITALGPVFANGVTYDIGFG